LVVSAAEHKYAYSPGWEWLLWSVVVSLVLAALLWTALLTTPAPMLGVPVGSVLMAEGACTAVMVGRTQRRLADWLKDGNYMDDDEC
jgi:hypothetical protein